MSNIKELPLAEKFPKHQEMLDRIMLLIYEYENEVSTVAVLGILDLAKDQVKNAD